jgi:hypothetical protein
MQPSPLAGASYASTGGAEGEGVGVRVKPVEADTDGVREVEREVAFEGD